MNTCYSTGGVNTDFYRGGRGVWAAVSATRNGMAIVNKSNEEANDTLTVTDQYEHTFGETQFGVPNHMSNLENTSKNKNKIHVCEIKVWGWGGGNSEM